MECDLLKDLTLSEKQTLLKMKFAEKKATQSKRSLQYSVKLLTVSEPTINILRVDTPKVSMLADGKPIQALLDSGADVTVISRSLAQRESLTISSMRPPITVKMADGRAVIMVEQVAADWTVLSQTEALITPRRLVPVLPDCGSSQFLIGQDWLTPLPTGASVSGIPLIDTVLSPHLNALTPEDILKLCSDLPVAWQQRTFQLLAEYIDVFRTGIVNDPAASVSPCVTRLKPGAVPYFCKLRRVQNAEAKWLRQFTDELLKYGFIYQNGNSSWASTVLVVKKPDGSFRLVIDFREVNSYSLPTGWPMPQLDAIVIRMKNSKYFIKLDLFKGFWLLPLAEESREQFSFMTPDGVFTPLRLPQGACNSASQFQARMAEIFPDLINSKL